MPSEAEVGLEVVEKLPSDGALEAARHVFVRRELGTTAADVEIISFGESAIADQRAGYTDEGEEVVGIALMPAV